MKNVEIGADGSITPLVVVASAITAAPIPVTAPATPLANEAKTMNEHLSQLETCADQLSDRLVALRSPDVETPKMPDSTDGTLAPLCAEIRCWSTRVQVVGLRLEHLLQELQL